MSNLTLEEILDALPKINANRNYWFFRTNGGQFYNYFIQRNLIAIGYDKINLLDIKATVNNDADSIRILGEKIKNEYGEEETRPNYIASQLTKFAYGIKKGDIVFIPSYSSNEITFGEVIETQAFIDNTTINDTDVCPYYKRKKVKWIRTMSRDELDPNLYKLMFSHHTITETNNYGEFIDKITNSFFIKNAKAHLVLDVQTKAEIKAKDLFQMGAISLELLDDFCEAENLSYKSDDFNVKLNLQSPGHIELSGITMGGIVIIGIILVSLAGGGFSIKLGQELSIDLKTDGIVEKIRAFLKSNSNVQTKRALLEKHMKDLEIKDPEDLIKVLHELNKK
jgi:hypothetical protein